MDDICGLKNGIVTDMLSIDVETHPIDSVQWDELIGYSNRLAWQGNLTRIATQR